MWCIPKTRHLKNQLQSKRCVSINIHQTIAQFVSFSPFLCFFYRFSNSISVKYPDDACILFFVHTSSKNFPALRYASSKLRYSDNSTFSSLIVLINRAAANCHPWMLRTHSFSCGNATRTILLDRQTDFNAPFFVAGFPLSNVGCVRSGNSRFGFVNPTRIGWAFLALQKPTQTVQWRNRLLKLYEPLRSATSRRNIIKIFLSFI